MTAPTRLEKVLWRNGDVISEGHFFALEKWTEQLVASAVLLNRSCGLLRNAGLQPEYNDPKNLRYLNLEGMRISVEIRKFQLISRLGELVSIDAPRTITLQCSQDSRQPDGSFLLYLAPSSDVHDTSTGTDDTPTDGPVLYETPFQLSVSNSDARGIAVARFRIEDRNVIPDDSFLPLSVFIDSSPVSLTAHENVVQKLDSLVKLLEGYIESSPLVPEIAPDWNFASNLLRVCCLMQPALKSKESLTRDFLMAFWRLCFAVAAELKVLAASASDPTLVQKSKDLSVTLGNMSPVPPEDEVNLGVTLGFSSDILERFIDLLGYLPNGPVREKTLPIAQVDIGKEASVNRITVLLAGEAQFTRGKSRLTIHLREFSKSDPGDWSARVGLGSVIFAQLLVLENAIRKPAGQQLSYILECPPEIVTRDRATQITLYLPPPLGEGVSNLKSHVFITVRD